MDGDSNGDGGINGLMANAGGARWSDKNGEWSVLFDTTINPQKQDKKH